MDTQGLTGICTALGEAEEDEYGNRIGYAKGDSCLDNLKDLLRFLRRDDPQKRDVFKQVCKWKIVSKDLVPILQFCQNDRNLVLNAVKVLVFLTMPIEPSSNDITQQTEYLWDLKSAITNSDVIAVIVSLLEGPLENLEREMLNEDDWKLVQLVMTFFRNVLAIQDISLMQKVGGSASHFLSLRDRFLELLFRESVMDIVIVITQHVGGSHCYFRQDNLLLLEIFHHIFMGQDPELIAKAHPNDSKVGEDIKASIDGLKCIMEEEKEKKRLSRKWNMDRHSQFCGTFARVTMDGSKAVCMGNPSSSSCNIMLRHHKAPRGPTKKIVWDNGRLPSMKESILGLLHDFLNQFLSGGYNVLMRSVHDDIEKETQAIQSSDVVVFFHVAQFVTAFQHQKFLSSKPTMEREASQEVNDQYADSTYFNGDICGPIAASMSESMFLLVLSRWRYAFDGLKETHDYQFLSVAGSLMKTMIRMLDLVLKLLPEDYKEPQTARVLLYKLFYDQTDQGMAQFLLNLIKSFDTHKQPKSDLADLVEMIYVIVRLMENLQARGTLRVSKRSRRARKKKEQNGKQETGIDKCGGEASSEHQPVLHHAENATDWDALQKKNLEDSNSEHHVNTNISIQVNEPEIPVPDTGKHVGSMPQLKNRENNNGDDVSCSSEDFSGDKQPPATYEADFKVSTFVSAIASHSMIKNLCWLLAFYKSNKISTNHYIISVLRRITDDLYLSPMLYQLSLLTIFYDILEEQKPSNCKEYAEIVDFLTTLVRRMIRKMKNQPFLFVELLFWKSRRECHYINAEYLLHELGNTKKKSSTWGSASANGELGPYQSREWEPRSIADALGDDEADVVIQHDLGYQNGGNSMEDEIDEVPKRKRRLVLTEELGSRMKELYEKFKDDKNCCHQIAESLGPDVEVSPAQIFNKLKLLGLKVAPKKRMRHMDRPLTTDPILPPEKERTVAEDDLHKSIDSEGNTLNQSLSRKRLRVFGKDEEEMIKALFEQFKDHKRCNNMIANALGADNSFTPAQVARKLKQLGLKAPQRKQSKTDTRLRHEEQTIFDTEVESDDETLLSLINRRKHKDVEKVSTLQPEKQDVEQLNGDSDNEILDSILKKRRKLLPKANDNLTENSTHKKPSDEDTLDDAPSVDAQNNGGGLSTAMQPVDRGINEDTLLNNIAKGGASEVEAIEPTRGSSLGFSTVGNDDSVLQEEIDDDLADSDDDEPAGELMDASLRRKLRMVVDLDDDDDY